MSWPRAIHVLFALLLAGLPAVADEGHGRKGEFPLRVAESGRYLEDATGRPFLVHGDTAWSLIAELTREEAEAYLADRSRRGFNAIIVNLLEHEFATNAPANAYGERPFAGSLAFADMNERYFEHAEWILRRAREMGIAVFLAPAYLGAGGGSEGWFRAAGSADAARLRDYGAYVGRRFAGIDNIVWMHGGDFDAPDKALVRSVVAGIDGAVPHALHTVHSGLDTVTAHYWAGEPWLAIDTTYTYGDVHAAVLARTTADPGMPVIMIEGAYEGEHGAGAEKVRIQAYGAMLAGAAGQFFGNNPIWHFSGPGLYTAEQTWRESLDSPGAQSMTHLRALFDGLEWWRLEPGARDSPIMPGNGLFAAASRDGSLALAYLFDSGAVQLSSHHAGGRSPGVRWFDPANGSWHRVAALPDPAGRTHRLKPPSELNSGGRRDWLLVVEAGKATR